MANSLPKATGIVKNTASKTPTRVGPFSTSGKAPFESRSKVAPIADLKTKEHAPFKGTFQPAPAKKGDLTRIYGAAGKSLAPEAVTNSNNFGKFIGQ